MGAYSAARRLRKKPPVGDWGGISQMGYGTNENKSPKSLFISGNY